MDSNIIVLLRLENKGFWVSRHYSYWRLVVVHLFVDLILKHLFCLHSIPLIFILTYLLLIIVVFFLRNCRFQLLLGIFFALKENFLFKESLSFLFFLLLFLFFEYLTPKLLSLLNLVKIILNMHFLHFLFKLGSIFDRHLCQQRLPMSLVGFLSLNK